MLNDRQVIELGELRRLQTALERSGQVSDDFVRLLTVWLESEADDQIELIACAEEICRHSPCPLARQVLSLTSATDRMHKLTLPGERTAGLTELRDFTKGAESLMIIDPYIFEAPGKALEPLAEEFKRSARITGPELRSVHFVYDSKHLNKRFLKAMRVLLQTHGVTMTEAGHDTLHDRVWIKDRTSALVVGHSFNGLGSKAAFLLPLPEDDLRRMLAYLDDNGLTRSQSRMPLSRSRFRKRKA